MPKFSLVVPTRGRPQELVRLFDSLHAQVFKDFEVVLIDQNADRATLDVVTNFIAAGGKVIHLRPGALPLSAARNVGLKEVSGEFIAFPDDDCHYPEDLLAQVVRLMQEKKLNILSCRACDPVSGQPLLSTFPKQEVVMAAENIFGIGMSITLFFRATAIEGLHFDETLGVGCEAGSGEETDFLIRVFRRIGGGMFTPQLQVFHPSPPKIYDSVMRERALKYGIGFGVVMRRHFNPALVTHFIRCMIIRPLGGALLSLHSPAKALWCLTVLRGRWEGFLRGK